MPNGPSRRYSLVPTNTAKAGVYTFENAEVALFGCDTDDPIILDAYYSGKNLHDINTRTLFAIDSDSPLWGSGRDAAKIMQFGRYQYGGGLRSIHRQLVLKAPKLNLTLKSLEAADARYWEAHPKIREWDERVSREVETERVLRNEFGRFRVFANNTSAIAREGKNFRIQSACASIINRATISIRKEILERNLKAFLVMQVHDQLVFECPVEEAPEVARLVRSHLEAPFVYKGTDRHLRVGLEWGPNFGDLKEITEIPDRYEEGDDDAENQT